MGQSISMPAKLDANNNMQFYIRKDNNGVITEYCITAIQGNNNYFTMMSGSALQCGSFVITTSPIAITFDVPYPNLCKGVVLTTENTLLGIGTVSLVTGTVSKTGFSAQGTILPRTVYYIALGY